MLHNLLCVRQLLKLSNFICITDVVFPDASLVVSGVDWQCSPTQPVEWRSSHEKRKSDQIGKVQMVEDNTLDDLFDQQMTDQAENNIITIIYL